jgi:hypothetical protein
MAGSKILDLSEFLCRYHPASAPATRHHPPTTTINTIKINNHISRLRSLCATQYGPGNEDDALPKSQEKKAQAAPQSKW